MFIHPQGAVEQVTGLKGNPALTFARLIKGVRQTLALHTRSEADYRKRQQQTEGEQAAERAAEAQRAASADQARRLDRKAVVRRASNG
ncbi:MAG: hypothetical protein JWM91_1490 [Rhodospirillales bacterium]|nr:hypothetical protein [Rhodospirillales bacterium]